VDATPADGASRPAPAKFVRQGVDQLRTLLAGRFAPNVGGFLADRQPLVWLLALTLGIGVAGAAILFRIAIGVFQLPWLMTMSERVASAAHAAAWWQILLGPTLGGLAVGLILDRMVPGRRPHAVADVIEARAIHDSRIDPKVGLTSAFLAALSLGSGASAGREGPVVHLGATLASYAVDRFHLSSSARRTLLAAGVAAAVSASFNAPIAGVLFAHEVILGHYALRAFVPSVISSVAAAVAARLYFGNFPAFVIPEYQITSYAEFPAFALLGLAAAAVAILFQLALVTTERITWRFEMPLPLRTMLSGLCVGTIALAFPEVLGVGYETTDHALYQKLPMTLLLSLIAAKIVATAVSLAGRFAGGIFSPTLYLGALTGAAFGSIATGVFPEMASSHGLYAILGMGAVAAAVLGAPISTTLIVFELTGGYDMTIALLLTVSIAVGSSHALMGQSYFHWQLERRGLFLQDGPHRAITRRLTVAAFMTAIEAGSAPVREADAPWLTAADTLERALRAFDQSGLPRIAVVSEQDPTVVVAWADRLAALAAFNAALIEATVEEHR
jgi:CIC family chloride channel protein